MNTYLINIFSFRLTDDEIKRITSNASNIVYFNYDDVDVNSIIDECLYCSLLDEDKYIIVKNFKINASSKPLEKYLDNPNPQTTLILLTNSIDKRSQLYKKISSSGKVIELLDLKPQDLYNKVFNYCQNNSITINQRSLEKLIEYNINNYDLVIGEIDKLSVISKKIDETVIEEYSAKLNEDDIFSLCDAITSKNNKEITKVLENFINTKMDVIPLVSALASQYRIILTTKQIKESNDTIATLLNIHPYRVKLAKEKANLYSKEELEDILISLCDLDYNLKSINANQYSLLKEFLIKIL